VTFVLERNVQEAANDVREKVATVVRRFPAGTESPVIEKFDPDASPIMALVVSGKRSPREITEIADKRIKRQLEAVKDIGAITLVGERKREIQVVIDPFRLQAYGLSIQQVKAALQQQNVEVPGGRLTADRHEATIGEVVTYTIAVHNRSGRDLRSADGTAVTVRDLLPAGFRPADGRVRLLRPCPGAGTIEQPPVTGSGTGVMEIGPFDLPAGAPAGSSLPPGTAARIRATAATYSPAVYRRRMRRRTSSDPLCNGTWK
jgi:uncharacterized repeat protein (TIGR01451 family)